MRKLHKALICSFSLLLLGCAQTLTPRAQEGILDLRNHDWSSGPVSLAGEWKFYWKEFADPTSPGAPTGFISAPGKWNAFTTPGGKAGGQGYATYRLEIALGPGAPQLSLRTLHFDSSSRIYVNGKLLEQVGQPGTSAQENIADRRPGVIQLERADRLDLLIHVANFEHRNGGFPRDMLIGPTAQIEKIRLRHLLRDLFLCGSLCMMALYHFALFALRSRDRAPLYFGLFCLLIAVRSDLVGERVISQLIFDSPQFALLHRIEYISFFLATPCFLAYTSNLFPGAIFRRGILIAVTIVFLAGSTFVLMAPSFIYTQTLFAFQIFMIAVGLYIMAGAVYLIIQKRIGARVFVGTFVIFFVSVINDILYSRSVVNSGFFVALGLFLFTFTQAFLLSRLYAESFRRVEELAIDLENSERRYRHLVEDSGEIILSLDDNGIILSSNQAAVRILGYSPRELTGRKLSSLIFDAGPSNAFMARHLFEERLVELVKTDRAQEFPAHFSTAQSDVCELNVRLQRVALENGRAIIANLAQKPLDILARYCLEDHRHYLLSNSFQMGELLNHSLTAGLESRVPEEEHILVRLALREMMINAIEHGNLGITFAEKTRATENGTLGDLIQQRLQNPVYAGRKIHVKIDADESRVEFTIRDEGEGFDHKAMIERATRANETDSLYHGRGLRFALSFFNSVEYNEIGNEVRLTRLLK